MSVGFATWFWRLGVLLATRDPFGDSGFFWRLGTVTRRASTLTGGGGALATCELFVPNFQGFGQPNPCPMTLTGIETILSGFGVSFEWDPANWGGDSLFRTMCAKSCGCAV